MCSRDLHRGLTVAPLVDLMMETLCGWSMQCGRCQIVRVTGGVKRRHDGMKASLEENYLIRNKLEILKEIEMVEVGYSHSLSNDLTGAGKESGLR